MTGSRRITICVGLALALCGCQALPDRLAVSFRPRLEAVRSQAATITPTIVATTQSAQPTAVPTPPAILLSTQQMEEGSKEGNYSIRAYWPVMEWQNDPRAEAFNQAVQRFVNREIGWFRENIPPLTGDPLFDNGSFLEINYQLIFAGNELASILFTVTSYSSGAAHPGHHSYPVNFDTQSGRVLALEDLFIPGVPYLNALATYCMADLKTRDIGAWEDGAMPAPENYRVWNLTAQGLQITFDEYQVAAYAAGPQTVIVPYDVLEDMIRPEGPLSRFAP